MIKELYKQTVNELSLNVTQSKIDAVMKKKITKSGCRVYHEGLIGIAGTLGEPTDATWAEARNNLNRKIAYAFEPEKNKKRIRDLREITISDDVFVLEMEDLLENLRRQHPDFIFSNKIKLIETEIVLSNDAGLDYCNRDRDIIVALLVKHVDSLNIFDTMIVSQSRSLDKDKILKEAGDILQAFNKEAVIPKQEKMTVVIQQSVLLTKVIESLNGESIGLGTSLFCNKVGTKAFNDRFNVYQDSTAENHHVTFFDMEGIVNAEDKSLLIERGTIIKPYTDKKQAAAFGFSETGAAGGSYDDVPTLGYANLSIMPGDLSLKELLNGEQGIAVVMASGGDYTAEGNYASPVQMAYMTDGEHLLGKLPELSISGSLYEIFGDDFIGLSKDKALMGERALVIRMKVN